jgi:acetolactate synthase-1/2/3 large subunit
LVRALEREGTEIVFGYPGGAIMPVYDALVDAPLRHVLVRHEQAAALAADGYARATGRVGVCMATSGPGATNLVTGIANAHLDSVPMVAITGQVPSPLIGTDAFQEVDIVGMTLPVVKHSFAARSAGELPELVREAFRLARGGRPGPVLIDLPKDVAMATTEREPLDPADAVSEQTPADAAVLDAARALLREAERPVAYVGGGVVLGRAVDALRTFVEAADIPVVTTLKGLGVLPRDHARNLGMLGMHGNRAANVAVQHADLLVCVGARFDDRATGNLAGFAPHAKVIHLDVDPAEVGKLRRADVAVVGSLASSLRALAGPTDVEPWRTACEELARVHAPRYDAPGLGVYAPRLLRRLGDRLAGEGIVACDVGQHQMWVAQHYRVDAPARHLSSGGLGTMGFGLPAAIGAQLGCPKRPVVAVTGDGSIMMNLQELATIRRYELPIKIVLVDNAGLGMVRQWQELFFDRRYSEVDLSDNPDFVALARAFGIPAFELTRADEEDDAIDRLMKSSGPMLAHVRIDPAANVWPLVRPGSSNLEMMEEDDVF